ncbi:MAG TPA: hypothetical protein VK674_04500 [Candidatus Limnocylindria bacterium]|nr:hypothetical protein [Candidatus Limnocylindria bacterium]
MPKNSKPAKAPKKKPNKTPAATPTVKRRMLLKLPTLLPGRLSGRQQRPAPAKKLSGSFGLFADCVSLWRQHWKIFGGITLVYLLLSLLLVGGLGGGLDVPGLKEGVVEEVGQLNASIALFGLLVGSAGSVASESGAVYQTIVLLLVSLAAIWALRQVHAEVRISVRDAFYKGIYPLVPFVLVFLFICLELVPLMIASFVYVTVLGGGLVAGIVEQGLWWLLMLALAAASLYLLSASLFALYVVCLPDVRPMAAIRAANRLVRYRRWLLIRKLLFLPLALVSIGAALILPLIIFAPGAVQWVFAPLSMAAFVFAHTYFYSLYRELL